MSLPLENLDAKTFEQLVGEAKKRIPIYAPQWTDHNLHDPGITLIELFAWLMEMQIYRLNKVPDDALWTFLRLMGIQKASETEANGIQTLDQAVMWARKDMKTVTRAVTSEDYETLALALNSPGGDVARVKAIPRYHPRQHQDVPGLVTVVVVPASGSPGLDFLNAVYRHLDQHRLLSTQLFVTLPRYVEVGVQAVVTIKPEYLGHTIENKVKERLDRFLHPLTGGIEGKGWPFGRPVYISEMYEVIDGVEGVDYVRTGSLRLKRNNEEWQESDIPIPRHGLVRAGSHVITAGEDRGNGDTY
jgi:hypothetical protein